MSCESSGGSVSVGGGDPLVCGRGPTNLDRRAQRVAPALPLPLGGEGLGEGDVGGCGMSGCGMSGTWDVGHRGVRAVGCPATKTLEQQSFLGIAFGKQ